MILALLGCAVTTVDTSQSAAAYSGPVEITGTQVDCYSASWQIGVWTLGLPASATVTLHDPADTGAPPAEAHPLALTERDPRGGWSKWGVDLSYGQAVPGLGTLVACPAEWVITLQDTAGDRVGCVGDPESAC